MTVARRPPASGPGEGRSGETCGTAGVVPVGYIGLCFALIYQWRGSLVAPMVMHFMQDFPSIILAPLLGIK